MRSMFPHFLVLFILNFTITYGNAAPRNFTIDDEKGDEITGIKPAYSPIPGWKQACPNCDAKPDPARIFMRTWHSVTYRPTDSAPRVITLSFNGSAIYVYFILANGHTDDLTQRFPHTLLSFRLDKVPVGPDFRHEPQKNKGFEYNAPVYVNTTLSAGPHDLDIIADGPTEIIILFDYAVYTSDPDALAASHGSDNGFNDNSASRSKANIPAIAGGTVGGILVICLVGLVLIYRCRRRRQSNEAITDIDGREEHITRELSGQTPIRPSFTHGGEVIISASASEPSQNHTTPDHFYESGPWQGQPTDGMTRKEMERRREHLVSRMREMQQPISRPEEIRPEDSVSCTIGTTMTGQAVLSNENSRIRQIVEGLRAEIGQLSAQLERQSYRDELPPAY